jgi:hypothetical protein
MSMPTWFVHTSLKCAIARCWKPLGSFFAPSHIFSRASLLEVSLSCVDTDIEMVVMSEATKPRMISRTSSANTPAMMMRGAARRARCAQHQHALAA